MVDGRKEYAAADYEKVKNIEPVHKWMTANPFSLLTSHTLKEAVHLLDLHHIDGLPVISFEQQVIGLITKSRLMKLFVEGKPPETRVGEVMNASVVTIGPDDTIEKAYKIPVGRLPVVDEQGRLIGMLTRTDILHSYFYISGQLQETIHTAETLNVILESAYEGIAVIDKDGIIHEFNNAYCRFIGRRREEVIGKHVTEVIDNTRLHIVSVTGVEERGYIQRIQGQDMVVHRIPIRKEGEVIGAIGMLIFEGVTELYNILGRMQELSRKVTESTLLTQDNLKDNRYFEKIIGNSDAILSVKKMAGKAAKTPSTVLITGESGTGKELFAEAIHHRSPYAEGPFVSVNCAAIPEHLLEAELFGYEEGAFTGARKGGKQGKFELAHKGTLFLDEIGDMTLPMQAKILRVLQDRTVERVGGIKSQQVDVRIVAATNVMLEEMVRKGTFREDLYYRLNIIRLNLPPLRERKEDIPLLLSHHLRFFSEDFSLPQKFLSVNAMAALKEYKWPGNVRELINTVEMLVSLAEGQEISEHDLPGHILGKSHFSSHKPAFEPFSAPKQNVLEEVKDKMLSSEKEAIIQALREVNGNKAAAARKLGIQRSTLYEKLKKHGLIGNVSV
ncbi:sigma-54-dependent Fis family transcriptional regulator [Bacillus sp. V5-8f]|uniref:sigma-54-dependent Fis family transcriptional regulator n=1 Tax=Bacillus sp. V5-8f TaxID=2053044 RepID=UPI000C780DF0|nr:sigma-54-dependent Fis family transcriptional regulator [Bacillus sp. V5-8f]PLT32742.1 sigma-54-dependent Fis family transcriptional regulator [Bacillus sp. V5-8f]